MQQSSAQPLPPRAIGDIICVTPLPSLQGTSGGDVTALLPRERPVLRHPNAARCHRLGLSSSVCPGDVLPGIQDCMQARLPLGEAQGDL